MLTIISLWSSSTARNHLLFDLPIFLFPVILLVRTCYGFISFDILITCPRHLIRCFLLLMLGLDFVHYIFVSSSVPSILSSSVNISEHFTTHLIKVYLFCSATTAHSYSALLVWWRFDIYSFLGILYISLVLMICDKASAFLFPLLIFAFISLLSLFRFLVFTPRCVTVLFIPLPYQSLFFATPCPLLYFRFSGICAHKLSVYINSLWNVF